MMLDIFVDVALLTLIAIHAIAIIRMRSLFAVTMLFGGFSFLSAGLFVVMDAADVAFTEAAVGAGISGSPMLTSIKSIFCFLNAAFCLSISANK